MGSGGTVAAPAGGTAPSKINLSSPEIYAPELIDSLQSVLHSSGLPARNLVLEVTESVLIPDADAAADVLRNLKSLGVRVALDDFGSGFSSLRYLDALPIDILKIDQQFVSGGGRQGHHPAVLESIATLGQRLGLDVVAEGIEEPHQLEMLRSLGCTAGQGYLLARPGTPAAISALVSSGRLDMQVLLEPSLEVVGQPIAGTR